MALTTHRPLDLGDIAKTLIAALDDDALDELARRVANRHVRPEMLDVKQAAKFLGVSTATLRRSESIRRVFLEGCSKPLYRMKDLDMAIERAAKNGRRVE